MNTVRSRVALFAVIMTLLPVHMHAQESRLVGRLPDPARLEVDALLNEARVAGLPAEPLVDRALEGVAKGAPPDLIVGAVRRLRDELTRAREAFGSSASPAELTAGASALRAGATPADLRRLRELRTGQPLTVPAGVLADLVAAGVPIDDGLHAVLALAETAEDTDYVLLQRNVERDISLGASPAAAVGVRLRAIADAASTVNRADGGGIIPRKRKP